MRQEEEWKDKNGVIFKVVYIKKLIFNEIKVPTVNSAHVVRKKKGSERIQKLSLRMGQRVKDAVEGAGTWGSGPSPEPL